MVLSVEPSWANIADKLCYGLLDGAMLLPPLALALRFGLSGSAGPEKILVPAALSLNGNTVTLSERWTAAIAGGDASCLGGLSADETAQRFATVLRRSRDKPHLAVVHTFSTHNLLLRYWLATAGIDPDRDVTFTVVPPAQTVEAMAAGRIDGFCVGAPWGEVAARAGLGHAVADIACDLEQRHRKGLRGASIARRAIPRPAAGGIAGAAARRQVLRQAGECSGSCRAAVAGQISRPPGGDHSDVAARRGLAAVADSVYQRRCLGVLRQCRQFPVAIACPMVSAPDETVGLPQR